MQPDQSDRQIEFVSGIGHQYLSFGVHYPKANRKKPDIDRAIEHAIQLFEDGIVCIFNGDRRLESLDDTFDPQQPFTFVRLTMLSGRMW